MVQHGDSDTTLFLSASIHRDHFFQVITGSKPERRYTLPLKALEICVSHSIDFSPLFSFTLSVSAFHFSWTKNIHITQYILQRSCQIRTQVNSTSSGSFGSVWESVITWWNTLLWQLCVTRTHPHRKRGQSATQEPIYGILFNRVKTLKRFHAQAVYHLDDKLVMTLPVFFFPCSTRMCFSLKYASFDVSISAKP